MRKRNRESATNLYAKARSELEKQAQSDPTGRTKKHLDELDAIYNAPSLYSDIGKAVKKVFKKKPKEQAAAAPTTPSVKPVAKPISKPVDEKRTPTEPIDIIGDVELIPPVPVAKKPKK